MCVKVVASTMTECGWWGDEVPVGPGGVTTIDLGYQSVGSHLARVRFSGYGPWEPGQGEQSYSDLFERLATVDLLHLDDLGAEKQTEWVIEQLYAVVNERYERQRALIVTSNVEPDDLEKQLGPRVVSRLVEMCGDPVMLFDDDRRMRVSADVATSLGEGGGSALGPLDH